MGAGALEFSHLPFVVVRTNRLEMKDDKIIYEYFNCGCYYLLRRKVFAPVRVEIRFWNDSWK